MGKESNIKLVSSFLQFARASTLDLQKFRTFKPGSHLIELCRKCQQGSQLASDVLQLRQSWIDWYRSCTGPEPEPEPGSTLA